MCICAIQSLNLLHILCIIIRNAGIRSGAVHQKRKETYIFALLSLLQEHHAISGQLVLVVHGPRWETCFPFTGPVEAENRQMPNLIPIRVRRIAAVFYLTVETLLRTVYNIDESFPTE